MGRSVLIVTFFLVTLLIAAPAAAQVCSPELAAVLAGSGTPDHVSGIEAVRVLRAAVELIEPALPRLVLSDVEGLAPGEPGYDDALFLRERQLLPAGWQPERLTRPVWQELARRLLAWYGLEPMPVRDPASEAVFLEDVALLLARAAAAVRPAGLIAVDPDDRDQIGFWGLIWNWTVFPRLIVFRPREGVSLAGGVEQILPLLGSCALDPRSFVTAPERTATRLFQATNASQMVIVAGVPREESRWPYWVAAGDELSVLAFRHPEVVDLDAYSVVFVGPPVGPAALLRLLPQVRTNLSPRGLLRYLETP